MNVLLYIHSLRAGGAERAIVKLSNYLVEHGHRVTLATHVASEEDHYQVDDGVDRVCLGYARTSRGGLDTAVLNLRRATRLRQLIIHVQPDCLVAFMFVPTGVASIASIGMDIPMVASERSNPASVARSRIAEWFLRWAMKRLVGLVVLSEETAQWMRKHRGIDSVLVIPNGVSLPLVQNRGQPFTTGSDEGGELNFIPDQCRVIACVGRLVENKSPEQVVDAFSRALRDHAQAELEEADSWHLVFVGEGPLRDELVARVEALGLAARVHFLGRRSDVQPIYERAEIYVSASQYEGFPNALLEAMACGCSVIATDCPTGPKDIIDHKLNGLLVEVGDLDGLTDALRHLMGDDEYRLSLAARAREVLETYSDEQTQSRWLQLLERVSDIDRSRAS